MILHSWICHANWDARPQSTGHGVLLCASLICIRPIVAALRSLIMLGRAWNCTACVAKHLLPKAPVEERRWNQGATEAEALLNQALRLLDPPPLANAGHGRTFARASVGE
eukprot:1150516-Pelagomonas_calceolata.AAC.1